jgi:hypothetical protein
MGHRNSHAQLQLSHQRANIHALNRSERKAGFHHALSIRQYVTISQAIVFGDNTCSCQGLIPPNDHNELSKHSQQAPNVVSQAIYRFTRTNHPDDYSHLPELWQAGRAVRKARFRTWADARDCQSARVLLLSPILLIPVRPSRLSVFQSWIQSICNTQANKRH